MFEVKINAQDLTKSELFDEFRMLSQGQLSDLVVDKMTMTFTELCKLAIVWLAASTRLGLETSRVIITSYKVDPR